MDLKVFFLLSEIYKENGFDLYLVGGAVRDYLSGKQLSDFDIVSSAKPEETAAFIPDCDLSFKKYGSVTFTFEGYKIDVTTLRKEKYDEKSRIPSEVEFITDIREDSLRRDFTCNAIYMDAEGNLYDFHHGKEDIGNKILRMIGDIPVRMNEDPLRMLRCLRFSLQIGFAIEGNLDEYIRTHLSLLKKISLTQVNSELKRMKDISLSEYERVLKEYHLGEYILTDEYPRRKKNLVKTVIGEELNDIMNFIKRMREQEVLLVILNEDKYLSFIEDNPNHLMMVHSYQDIIRAKSEDKIAAALYDEVKDYLTEDNDEMTFSKNTLSLMKKAFK